MSPESRITPPMFALSIAENSAAREVGYSSQVSPPVALKIEPDTRKWNVAVERLIYPDGTVL